MREPHEPHGRRPAREVVLRFPTVVVQDDPLAVEPPDQHGGERRQHERPVRRGEDVNDVVARESRDERGNVPRLGEHRTHVLDPLEPAEEAGQLRIYREQVHGDRAAAIEVLDEPKRLHSLSAQDAERWRDDAQSQGRRPHVLDGNECAHMSR